jgi:hypothetical protein
MVPHIVFTKGWSFNLQHAQERRGSVGHGPALALEQATGAGRSGCTGNVAGKQGERRERLEGLDQLAEAVEQAAAREWNEVMAHCV